jgi:hypothetical protein
MDPMDDLSPYRLLKRLARVGRLVVVSCFVSLVSFGMALPSWAQVTITQTSEQLVIDIDGKPFTAFFIGGANLNRPYLYPLRSASGKIVTRSFPAGQLPGETTDHPHHAGLFYGHGDMSGYNYWAIQNVPTAPSKLDATMGRIVLDRVVRPALDPIRSVSATSSMTNHKTAA